MSIKEENKLSSEEYAKQEKIIQKLDIFKGSRDNDFKKIVTTYLSRGNLKKGYLDMILSSDIWDSYGDVFTSDTAMNYFDEKSSEILVDKESTKNYKVFGKLGNGVFNSFLSFYTFREFNEDRRVIMVQVYGDLKSKYGEASIIAPIVEKLGFWPYISASEYERKYSKDKLIVGVFYAIIGATYYILDKKFKKGVGYAICYNILTSIFKEYVKKLESDPEDLKPTISKLNEFIQTNTQYKIEYNTERKIIDKTNVSETTIDLILIRRGLPDQTIKTAVYEASNKDDSRKGAAQIIYNYLESEGRITKKEKITKIDSIYYGTRDDSFKNVIKDYLLLGTNEPKYLDVLLNNNSLKIYGDVFTSDTIRNISVRKEFSNNYEVFEKLGDGVFNSFFSFYSFRDFGEDRRTIMSQLYSDLKSKYGKGSNMSPIAEKLGFWDFISSSKDQRIGEKKKLLEDVFEAIIGATYYILDKNFRQGVGYTICYNILENIYKKHIVLETNPQDLKPAVSKLNEFNSQNVEEYKIDYVGKRLSTTGDFGLTETKVILSYVKVSKPHEIIGIGKAATKKDSKEEAAKKAYKFLVDKGIFYKKLENIANSAIENNDISTLKSTLSSIDSYGLKQTDILNHLILEAVKYGNHDRFDRFDIVKLLIEYGADVNTHDGYSNYLLTFAQFNINIFKLLLENGADINKPGRYGPVLVDYIHENGGDVSLEHIQFLIDSGADVNYNGNGTPLMEAISSGANKLELIKFLLDKGANNFEAYEDGDGWKVIHYAFQFDNENLVYQIVKLLVDAGANVNAPTSEYEYTDSETKGETPIMFAIKSNYISVVKFLLENGADIYIKSNQGKDALTFAREEGNTDIINLILSYTKEQEILNTLISFLKSTDLSTTTDTQLERLHNVDAIEHMMENIVSMVHGDSK